LAVILVVLMASAGAALVAGAVAWALPNFDPAAPHASPKAVVATAVKETEAHPRLAAYVRERVDPARLTGLALTVSTLLMRGVYYQFLALLHAMTVIAALLFLPFGKFFHIFQRPAQIGVKLYARAGDEGPGAMCARCGSRFASLMHVNDLRQVLGELGYDYATPGPAGHWQALCPACKRASLGSAQLRLREESLG